MRPEGRPLVSIVTPSFNQGDFIAETIASVLAQDYSHLEYLVVDGGSTDGTLEVLRSFGDRLRWLSEPDEGQAAAINKGWRQVQGDIIAWLNADDLYLPSAISRVVKVFQDRPDLDMVYGDCILVDSRGQFIYTYPARSYDYLALLRTSINFATQPAVFLRRRVLDSVGFLDESLHYVMDFDYWIRLGLRHTAAYVPIALAAARLHRRAKSVEREAEFGAELIRVYQRFFARPDLPPAIRAIESEAMGSAYYMAAVRCFWGGAPRDALTYGRTAWRQVSRGRRRKLSLLLPLAALGYPGVAVARLAQHVVPRTMHQE